MNTTAAFPVQDTSQAAEPRRAAMLLAQRLGFSDERAGTAALIVTELATNLAKHAVAGEILMRPLGSGGTPYEPPGIEILAVDAGPGIRDEALARRDGYSSTGTLGHGLGAVERQSHFFQIYTQPSGTVAVARVWRDRMPAPLRRLPYDVGAVHVSMPGEDVCGDDWRWHATDGRLTILVADGLGHGLAAHDASRLAVRLFEGHEALAPERIIADIHAGLRPTRGAAVAVAAVDLEREVLRYCGLGNITAVLLHAAGTRHSLVSQNGTAGHAAARIHEYCYPMPPESMLVMASDGLAGWNIDAFPGIRTRHPSVVAGVLYRHFSRRRDDVTVVVARDVRRADRRDAKLL